MTTKQESYTSAYSPVYGTKVNIIEARMSRYCQWLFKVAIKTQGGDTICTTLAESQLEDFE